MKSIICIIFGIGVLFAGCYKTEGKLKIEGKVFDESTKVQIPGRKIIIQGLLERNSVLVPVDAGQFSTDSTGEFIYSLKKVKDARFYNFCVVGDSNYAAVTNSISLFQLVENAKYLSFPISKLADLTIKIKKLRETPYRDTLYLSWQSDKCDFRTLYPYQIENYGISDNTFALISGFGLRWIGGNINSTIRTKVFADKITTIHWELVRNKKRFETVDTIICKRDLVYVANFTY